MEGWLDYVRFGTAMLTIIDPIGTVPMFVTLTSGRTSMDRRRAANAAALTTAVVLVSAVACGEWLLRAFAIDVPSFQVGGGILILLMAVSMMHARPSRTRHTPEEAHDAEEQATIGVVPLGTPLLAGPGAISTAIIYANKAAHWGERFCLILVCLGLALGVWVVLRMSGRIGDHLGRTGINIITRLMGLILAAVAVKFIADGTGALLPGLRMGGC
jgi:multiple antibiotic resistance protein